MYIINNVLSFLLYKITKIYIFNFCFKYYKIMLLILKSIILIIIILYLYI